MRAVYVTEQGTVTEHGCGIIRIQSEKSIKYEIHKYVINVPSYNLFEHSKTLYYNFPNFLLEIKNKNLLFFFFSTNDATPFTWRSPDISWRTVTSSSPTAAPRSGSVRRQRWRPTKATGVLAFRYSNRWLNTHAHYRPESTHNEYKVPNRFPSLPLGSERSLRRPLGKT